MNRGKPASRPTNTFRRSKRRRFYRRAKFDRTFTRSFGKPELKGIDQIFAENPVVSTLTTNADITRLPLVGTGPGNFQRIGRTIHMHSIRIKCNITGYSSVVSTTWSFPRLRVFLVHDKSPNGDVIPDFDTIFGDTDPLGSVTTYFESGIRFANMDRFTLLREAFVDFGTFGPTSDNAANFIGEKRWLDWYVKLKNSPVTYNTANASPSVTDLSTGGLLLGFRGENNTTERYNAVDGTCRVRYYDV